METVKNILLPRPPHQPKVETVKNQLFQDQDHHILQIWKLLKISSSKTTTTTQNAEIVKNQLFQDHHILQIWKLLKISSSKTTTPTKSRNC